MLTALAGVFATLIVSNVFSHAPTDNSIYADTSSVFDGGLTEDEYLDNSEFNIYTKDQFLVFASSINNVTGYTYEERFIYLRCDLDLSGVTKDKNGLNYFPIGWYGGGAIPFCGRFIGMEGDYGPTGAKVKYPTISNLTVKASDTQNDSYGLFAALGGHQWGYTSMGGAYVDYRPCVQNIRIKNSNFNLDWDHAACGALAGIVSGDFLIENVLVENVNMNTGSNINASTIGQFNVGGLVGYLDYDFIGSDTYCADVVIKNCNVNGFWFTSNKYGAGTIGSLTGITGYRTIAGIGPSCIEYDSYYDANEITVTDCSFNLHLPTCSSGCVKTNHWKISGNDYDGYAMYSNFLQFDRFPTTTTAYAKDNKEYLIIEEDETGVMYEYNTYSSRRVWFYDSTYNNGQPILMGWLVPLAKYFSSESLDDTDNVERGYITRNGTQITKYDSTKGEYIALRMDNYQTINMPNDLRFNYSATNERISWGDTDIRATANDGYIFKEWVEDSTTVSGKTIYVATFEVDPNADDGGGGGGDDDDSGDDDGGDIDTSIVSLVKVECVDIFNNTEAFSSSEFYINNGTKLEITYVDLSSSIFKNLWNIDKNGTYLDSYACENLDIGNKRYDLLQYRVIYNSNNTSKVISYYMDLESYSFTVDQSVTIRFYYFASGVELTFQASENTSQYNGETATSANTEIWVDYSSPVKYVYTSRDSTYSNQDSLRFEFEVDDVVKNFTYVAKSGYRISGFLQGSSELDLKTMPSNATFIANLQNPTTISVKTELAQCTVTISELGDYTDMTTLTISTPGEEDVSTTEPFVVEMGTIINFTSNRIDGIFTYTYVFVYNEETIKTITYEMKDALYAMQFELDTSGERVKLLNSLEGEYPSETFTIDGITTLTISPTFGLLQYSGGLG